MNVNTVYINGKQVGQCTYAQIRPTGGRRSFPEYDVEIIDFVCVQQQPQLNDNQMIKTNNNLVKINDLAFELQHDDELTKEQWDKVGQIYKLSLPMQLNENQQIVLDWLKGRSKGGSSLFNAVQGFVGFNGVPILELNALMSLSNKEEAQVLQAFSQWALEQEED